MQSDLVEMLLEFLLGVTQLADSHLDGEVDAAALSVDVVARRLKHAVRDGAQSRRAASLFLRLGQVALGEVRPLVHRRRPVHIQPQVHTHTHTHCDTQSQH